MARQLSEAVKAATAPSLYALSTPAGCECVAHALQSMCEADPQTTILSIDGIGAFDLVSRTASSVVCAGCSTGLRRCHSSACSLDKHQCTDALLPLLFSLAASGIAGSPGAVAKRKGVRIFGRCACHHHPSTGWRHLPLVRTRIVDPCQHPGPWFEDPSVEQWAAQRLVMSWERISRAVNGGNVWRDFRPIRGSRFWGLLWATHRLRGCAFGEDHSLRGSRLSLICNLHGCSSPTALQPRPLAPWWPKESSGRPASSLVIRQAGQHERARQVPDPPLHRTAATTLSAMLAKMRSRNTVRPRRHFVLPSVAVPTLKIVNVADLWPGTVCKRSPRWNEVPDSIQLMGCVTGSSHDGSVNPVSRFRRYWIVVASYCQYNTSSFARMSGETIGGHFSGQWSRSKVRVLVGIVVHEQNTSDPLSNEVICMS